MRLLDPGSNVTQEKIVRGQAYLLLRHLIDRAGKTDAVSQGTFDAAKTLVSGLITGKKIGTIGWLISVGLERLSQELAPLMGRAEDGPHRSLPTGAQVSHLQGELS